MLLYTLSLAQAHIKLYLFGVSLIHFYLYWYQLTRIRNSYSVKKIPVLQFLLDFSKHDQLDLLKNPENPKNSKDGGPDISGPDVPAKDEVKRLEGPPARSQGPAGP